MAQITGGNTTKNPRIIIEVIRQLIDSDFDGNVKSAAEEISRVAKLAYDGRRDYKPITPSILYAILADKSHAKFNQLEMISTYIGIPVGALLLLTRIMASKRDEKSEDLLYLRSVYKVLEDAFDTEIDYQTIKEIGTGNRQLGLFQ